MKLDAKQAAKIKDDSRHLKEWILQTSYLPEADDDLFLENFLRGCKFSVERAKEVMDLYYAMRRGVPEIFGHRDPLGEDQKEFREAMDYYPLPGLTPDGYLVHIFRYKDLNPEKWNMPIYAKHMMMVEDILLHEAPPNEGTIYVYDLNGMTWSHALKVTLPFVKKYIMCTQNAQPVKIKGLHFVNAPGFFENFMAAFRPFMKKKISDRLMVHAGTIKPLYKLVPKEMLPPDYGGKGPTWESLAAEWVPKLVAKREWFLENERMLKELPPRPGKLPTVDEMFGMEGNFRKLAID